MYDNFKFVGMNSDNSSINTLFQYNAYEQESYDYIPQMPYEDEYSQSGCMDEQCSEAE